MLYLKSAIVGVLTALAAVAIWICATIVVPLFLPLLVSRISDGGTGSGGIGAVSVGFAVSSISILFAALAGFTIGFLWTLRRGASQAR